MLHGLGYHVIAECKKLERLQVHGDRNIVICPCGLVLHYMTPVRIDKDSFADEHFQEDTVEEHLIISVITPRPLWAESAKKQFEDLKAIRS
jgi:hypothetical protein